MGWKRAIAGIAAGFGFLIAGDYACGMKIGVNYPYCTIDSIVNGFDRNEIEEVHIAVYTDSEMNGSETERCLYAFEEARQELLKEFGINLRVIGNGKRRIPDGASTYHFKANGNYKADINLFFVKGGISIGGESASGYANPFNNVILAGYHDSREKLKAIVLHEIGHLFYAPDTDDRACYMYSDLNADYDKLHWCDDERGIVRKYKHRWW